MKDNKAEASKNLILRLVHDYGRKHAPQYALAFLLMSVIAGCTSLSAWLMKDLINTIFVARDAAAMMYFPVIVSGIFIAKGIVTYFQEITLSQPGRQIVTDLRKRQFDHLLKMNLDYFRQHSSGEIVARVDYGAANARRMVDLVAVSLGRDGLTVIGLCGVMIWQDPIMFAMSIVAAPIAVLAFRKLGARAKKAARSETEAAGTIGSLMRETVQGAKLIKAFQLEDHMRRRMSKSANEIEQLGAKIVRIKAAVAPFSEAVAGVAIGAVILYGTLRSSADPEMPGRFFSFITALLMAGEPLRRLSRLRVELAAASVPVQMMYDMLDQPVAEPDDDPRPALAVAKGEVRFEDVRFSYSPGLEVLRGLDLVLEGGKTTALVGYSGAGKTTIFNLLMGLNLPSGGRILIDGTSISDVSLASLRRHVALLDQEAFLFEGSIEENIRGAEVDADRDSVRKAAEAARADAFIKNSMQGYATSVGELGSHLSGGQRQRIAVARAFFKDAPILLLDEPTSALDSQVEEELHRSIKRLAEGRTTIIIAHRLSTVLQADRIYVISEGKAVECGTHAQLLQRKGYYARLFHTQLVGPDEAASLASGTTG